MDIGFTVHLLPALFLIVVLAGVVLLALALVRRVHDSWHRERDEVSRRR
jgi:uncharacterized phage infection (PIP) family protein YhgE